jgi:hypothetical protein
MEMGSMVFNQALLTMGWQRVRGDKEIVLAREGKRGVRGKSAIH